MENHISRGKTITLSQNNKISLLLWTSIAFLGWFISGIFGLINVIISLIGYGVLSFLIISVVRFIFKKPQTPFLDFLSIFAYRFGIAAGLFVTFTTGLVAYQNYINPATMPLITLSNGTRILRMQAMSHIAASQFYTTVKNSLLTARKDGFLVFYEGVRPGSPENTKKLDRLLGIEFSDSLYNTMSELYGIQSQRDVFTSVLHHDPSIQNVDVSVDDIITIFEKKYGTGIYQRQDVLEAKEYENVLKESLASLSDREKIIFQSINRAMLNILMKEPTSNELLSSVSSIDPQVMDVILNERNTTVVSALQRENTQNIFIMYGLLHIEGIIEAMQKNDPRWQIVRVEYQNVF